MNALGQAIAQQQFNALVDVMSYEELYDFFGGDTIRFSIPVFTSQRKGLF